MNKLYFIGLLLILGGCKGPVPINYRTETPRDSLAEKMIRINHFLNNQDVQEIKKLAIKKHWKLLTDKRGYFYQILKNGKGINAADHMLATIQYHMSLLDGTLCESSDSLGLKTFRIGQAAICRGMDEAIKKLKKGGEARFVFPPFLAFGLIGDEKCVPARSTVVYEVKLVDLKN